MRPVAVLAQQQDDVVLAQRLGERLALPVLDPAAAADPGDHTVVLVVDGSKLQLVQTGPGAPGPVEVDFGNGGMRHRRRGGANELLGRAVGIGKKPALRVLDATAGLGRDAFVLADLGCDMLLAEREPVVAALLRAGLDNAQASLDGWLSGVAARMQLVEADARELDAAVLDGLDVIYLDPMFAPRSKRAAVKKEMALFQHLLDREDAGDDAVKLLDWALGRDVARVVVKRPMKGAALSSSVSLSHSIRGKAVRYDVYALRKLC